MVHVKTPPSGLPISATIGAVRLAGIDPSTDPSTVPVPGRDAFDPVTEAVPASHAPSFGRMGRSYSENLQAFLERVRRAGIDPNPSVWKAEASPRVRPPCCEGILGGLFARPGTPASPRADRIEAASSRGESPWSVATGGARSLARLQKSDRSRLLLRSKRARARAEGPLGGSAQDRYAYCHHLKRETALLSGLANLADWDQSTVAPVRGEELRADQLAAIGGVVQEREADHKLGEMLCELNAHPEGLTADQRFIVREWLDEHEASVRFPEELVEEQERAESLAEEAWERAHGASDFSLFAPSLAKVIELKRREAEILGYEGHPYDALLDDYEPGLTVAQLDPLVKGLTEGLVPIVRAIRETRRRIDTSFLSRRYPATEQEAACREIMAALGVDMDAARLDRAANPFCIGLAPTDVRITTRYDERWLLRALYGVFHELGHALYEQGFDPKWYGTPFAEACSYGIDESQSRFWENFIGRSRPFMTFLLPLLRKHLRRPLRGVTADAFYRAVNRVAATPIRTQADEVTYNLHIALRYELEKALMTGEIGVRDLPHLWNEGMQRLLGITPRNDAEGVLQDDHWAEGLLGYFPSYLKGNLYAAQLWASIRQAIPDVDARIARGEFAPILAWLRKHIHRHGRRFPPAELITMATGSPPDPRFFLDYLKAKYGEIYGIARW